MTLVAISPAAVPPPAFVRAFGRFLTSFPPFLDGVWQVAADLLLILAGFLVVSAIARRRFAVARDMLLAAVVAAVVGIVVGRLVHGSWPDVWQTLRTAAPPAWYPSSRIAIAGAIVMTASPHVTTPARRVGRWALAIGAFAVTVLGAASPLGTVAGLLAAVVAASAVHLVFGSSAGRPSLATVRSALAELGVPIRSLGAADRQPAGQFLVHAESESGEPLVVKVYGRDAHDAALLTTLWRTVWYREPGSPVRLGRLQQVEHEAFLTLFARQAGVLTDTVVTAGVAAGDDALLVLAPTGRVLADDAAPVPAGAELVERSWAVLDRLQRAGIAHGQLDDRHLIVDGDELGVIDFRGATVAASETARGTDQAQLLVTTALLAGEDVALNGALEALGAERLAAVLPFVQLPALTPRQRQLVRDRQLDLDHLRAEGARVTAIEPPEIRQLRRITLGAIVRVVLPAVAVVMLISGLAGLDFAEFIEELSEATWWLVVLGALIAQLARVSQAVSTLGASPVPLPLGPVYALQLAVSYVNIAIPTSAARIAVNIRFFQRHGVAPAPALTAGALDGFAGFVVQAILLVVLVVLTPASLDLSLESAASGAGSLLLVAIVIAAAAFGVVAAVGRWRRFVVGWIRRLGKEAFAAVRGLRSPRRLGLLIGGSLATELIFALALGTFARALGYSVGLDELLLINISVGLLAGLMPVPGGVGVAEGGLTFGLVQAGVPESVAFAAVLMYRLATFYLPPTWGYVALRWLERNEHL